jgi:solute carrier family 25 S-adenosylmethionine transporter 26
VTEIADEASSLSASVSESEAAQQQPPNFLTALVAGGLAGTSVDIALFPIDTLKTRLQSPQGFLQAGGFRGIYNGLGAAAAGSAPGAALFFSTYEKMKPVVLSWQERTGFMQEHEAISHMVAASMGESMACLVRVPTEVVKAKMQTAQVSIGLFETVRLVLQETHGSVLSSVTGGLYRGYGMTLMREIPFAAIQFPLYEKAKRVWSDRQGYLVSPWQAATCGSITGGFAAGVTTPLDLVKTRLMLGADKEGTPYKSAVDVIQRTYRGEGAKIFLRGIQPRVMWMSIGGFVFFGAYEGFKTALGPILG